MPPTTKLVRPAPPSSALQLEATAPLATRHGAALLHAFRFRDPDALPGLSDAHLALVRGAVAGRLRVPVRVHSECLTSEVLGALGCDCAAQLEAAQAAIAARGFGVLLYLRQEGRGIGLVNKIRAYALQAQGADTIEANERLGLPVDARRYDVAAAMLHALGVRSVELMTNSPEKVAALARLGIEVVERIPLRIPPTPHSLGYLEVKRKALEHDLEAPPRAPRER